MDSPGSPGEAMVSPDKPTAKEPGLARFGGDSEMAQRTRAFDWSKAPPGPPAVWPQSLKTAVQIVLDSRFPMFVWWGRELINFYNDAYIPMLGHRHPDALGRPAAEVWADIWPMVGPQSETVLREGRSTWNEERLLVMERYGFTEEAYFTYSYSPVPGNDGRAAGVFCAVTEDTARVLSQRRLRTLRSLAEQTARAKSAGEACSAAATALGENPYDLPFALIYLLEPEGRTAVLAGLTGLQSGTPASPASFRLHGADAAWPFQRVIETGAAVEVADLTKRFGALPGGAWPEPTRRAIVLPVGKSAEERPGGFVVAGLSPRLAFNEDYRGFLDLVAGHVATAIANARAREEERQRAEALAELDRAKTAFFSNVSHEFRTPLTLMLGPVEDVLAEANGGLPQEQRERLDVARRNGLRLQKLVNTLLDFSRIEAGRVRARYEPTDLAKLTAELASNFRSACEKAGLELLVDCPHLDEPVYVDRDMWEKVVLNLVSNAFKFTHAGCIEVRLRKAESGVLLTVGDSGIGIPPEEMPFLFERFHRVEGARGRTREGTGIGLALVKELARLHGGEVQAKSEVGRGSLFTVSVPLGKAHLPADRTGDAAPLTSTATGAAPYVEEALRWLPGGAGDGNARTEPAEMDGAPGEAGVRYRVLLADDNADMRDYITRLLSGRYDVEAVCDGPAALAAARDRLPDLILSDVMMPGLDGFGLLKELRADPRTAGVPILLLSARAGEEAVAEGMQAGADDYLTKPFGAKELLARVQAHLALAKMRREAGEAMRKQSERLRLLWEAATVLLTTDDPDAMLRDLFTRIAPQLGLDTYFNFLVDDSGAALRLGSCSGIPEDEVRKIKRLEFGQAVCGTVALRGQPIVATHIQDSDDPMVQLVKGYGVRSYACNPLVADGRLLGTLSFASRGRDEFDADELEFLATVSRYVTVAFERLRLVRQLREQDRRKDDFLATLAHELRNPLAPIRYSLELQRRAAGDGLLQEQARGLMDRQVRHMVRLIDDLLDISRVNRGKVQLRKERVDLAAVVHAAIESARPHVDERGHTLAVNLPAENMPLNADPTRLAQILSNLLDNAAKYTPPDGHITLTAVRQGSEVAVSVRDDGIGIPAEHLPHVFEMFSQVAPALERSQGGLGIGLALVKALVELHGGRVDARSGGAGRGSEFTVHLPAPETAADSQLRDHRADSRDGHGKCRVLIVDDMPDTADSLALLLSTAGHDTRTAHDGAEAVKAAAAFRPHVVLLDIGLPRMNGYDVARAIRGQPEGKDILLVALTGWGQDVDRQRALAAGFDHHMTKPVDINRLDAVLATVKP
jgi:signal transduction histidine kinase/DNA-binding response OmpR family regulator